jgi:integrase
MPRIPKPWFREQTQSWYVKIGGVQHLLGKDKKEADRLYHRLMADEGLARPVKGLAIGGLVEQFLADCDKAVEPDTVAWYRSFLDDFADRYPRLKPADIAPRHVRAWLAAERKRPWKQYTQRHAITILKRLLNWGVENRLIAENPIKDMERPAATVRERVLTDEERERILSWYPEGDPFRDFLIAMMEAGIRPGEAMKVTAADVDFTLGVWIIRGKTTRRTGRDRVIYMTPTLSELTRKLVAEHPEGPLFRNARGEPWNRQAINCRFRRKKNRKRDRLDEDITAYVYRHTYGTDALENGVPDATVAELMGHRGTAVLHKHYSKLREKREHLRKAAEQAAKRKGGH